MRIIGLVALTSLIALGLALRHRITDAVAHFRTHVRTIEWQSQCMNLSRAADVVVYEPELKKAQQLARRPDYWLARLIDADKPPVAAVLQTPAWFNLLAALEGGIAPAQSSAAVVFSHARNSPADHRRLVVVTFSTSYEEICHGSLYPYIIIPGARLGSAPARAPIPANNLAIPLSIVHTSEDVLRFYAGQLDSADPSHFTIAYNFNQSNGTIDGWLRDDETVILWPREGRIDWEQQWNIWFAIWYPSGVSPIDGPIMGNPQPTIRRDPENDGSGRKQVERY